MTSDSSAASDSGAASDSSKLCGLLGIERPVLLAPMARVAGGELAAAVSNAGGLGIIGGGYGDTDWITEQLALAGDARVGIGLITWRIDQEVVARVLELQPAAVWMSFGSPAEYVEAIHDAGSIAICQVGRVTEAVEAAEAGADVLVLQGREAGGHGRLEQTLLGLVPAVSDSLPDIPLIAAGGISDRRGFDAVAALGACGVALGTALYATDEALDAGAAKDKLVGLTGAETVVSTVYDVIRGPEWPADYAGRSARTELTKEWMGREDELRVDLDAVRSDYSVAVEQADMDRRVLWAGEGVDLIDAVVPAAEVVRRFPTA